LQQIFGDTSGNPGGRNLSFPASATSVCASELSSDNHVQVASPWVWPLVSLGVAAIVTLLLLRSTVISMVTIWSGSSTYSYGFVVLPLSALLVWRRRGALKTLQPTIFPLGLVFVMGFAAIWVVANVADVQVVQQFALVGLLETLIWVFLGTRIILLLRFPLLFLCFAIPAGESLVEPLQRITAICTVNALRLCGVPTVQDGLVFSTPSGDWKIAEACSGVRYLISSVVVGVLVAGVAFRTWKRRIAFVVVSGTVPILANALRAFLIVFLAYFTSARIASGVDHIVYGWIFFSLVTAALISVALRYYEPVISAAEVFPTAPPPSPSSQTSNRPLGLLWCGAVAIAIVASATAMSNALWSRTPVARSDADLWSAPADWLSMADPDPTWMPNFRTVDSRICTNGSRQVAVFVGFDVRRRRGVDLVNSSNAAGRSGEWELLRSGYRQANLGGKAVKVAEYMLGSLGQRRLVWVWYLSGGQMTAEPYRIKWMQAESRLSGRPGSVFVFAISTIATNNPEQAVSSLKQFSLGMSFPTLASSSQ
jgi:exosortase A